MWLGGREKKRERKGGGGKRESESVCVCESEINIESVERVRFLIHFLLFTNKSFIRLLKVLKGF